MSFRVIPQAARTLSSWWDDERDIDFSPNYQRKGHIWSRKQEQDLVDSVLNGFDIPKLYFADFTFLDGPLNQSRKKYAIIDGKQRMLAIFRFFKNEVPLSEEFQLYDEPDLIIGGLTYDELRAKYPKVSRRFENYNLTIMSVITDDEQKINELFLRLNASKPLSGAEIRNAMTGSVPVLVRRLVQNSFWKKVRFSRLRGEDHNTAAKLLLIEYVGTFVDTKKRQLDALVKEVNRLESSKEKTETEAEALSREFSLENTTAELMEVAEETQTSTPDIERAAGRVERTLARLEPLFVDNDPLLAQSAQIPVLYWLVREADPESLTYLRDFLEIFEVSRRNNRLLSPESSDRNPELDRYELMARTSNDRESIRGRYNIMRRLFDDYYVEHGILGVSDSRG